MKQRLTALILLCALLTGCAAAGKGEQPLTATVLAMDTVMNFTLYGGGMGEEQLRQARLWLLYDPMPPLWQPQAAVLPAGKTRIDFNRITPLARLCPRAHPGA